jgi:hypothetical protein
MRTRKSVVFCLISLILLLMVGVMPLAAQAERPIIIGQNAQGEISRQQPVVTFSLTIDAPQVVTIQVLAISEGFAPAYSVIAPSGAVTQTNANPADANVVQNTVTLSEIGTYIIQVQRASAALGQFVISVQTGAALPPPTPLILGQVVAGTLDPLQPPHHYSFSTVPNAILIVNVQAQPPRLSGPVVTLRDAENDETLAFGSARLIGTTYRLAPGEQIYTLIVASGSPNEQEQYRLCVGTEGGLNPCPPLTVAAFVPTVPPLPSPTAFIPVNIPPTAPCQVASASGAVINVRSAPTTSSSIVGRLDPRTTALVTGRLPDGTWYQVNLNGLSAWVSTSVVIAGGVCSGIPIVVPTGVPTPTSFVTATPPAATDTPLPLPTNTPPVVPTLNYSLPPVFGSTALTSGFVPDPFTVGITGGGPVNVSYLGAGCTGFTSAAPSFSVNYTAGAFPLLRFYFIGTADTTMVINTPSGSYVCVDDSFGTLNPTLDFNSPSSGRYDVWIGTFASGGSAGGTLYVTENSGNHP